MPLARRLAEDFPDRPEYRTILGRALSNFGIVLFESGRSAEAEPILREAIELNTPIMAKSPDDVQVQFYLAASHHNLGEALMRQGNAEAAVAEFRKAQAINEAMIKASPDKPRYRSDLGSDLDSLAAGLERARPAQGRRDLCRRQRDLRAVDRRSSRKRRLPDPPGHVPAQPGRRPAPGGPDRAGRADLSQGARPCSMPADPKLQTADCQRWQAKILFNLGAIQGAGAEDALKRSIAISQQLLAGKPGAVEDRHNLAIAQNNLGMLLVDRNRLAGRGTVLRPIARELREARGRGPERGRDPEPLRHRPGRTGKMAG